MKKNKKGIATLSLWDPNAAQCLAGVDALALRAVLELVVGLHRVVLPELRVQELEDHRVLEPGVAAHLHPHALTELLLRLHLHLRLFEMLSNFQVIFGKL